MRKYWAVVRITWQRALAYRFTIISYRVGEIAESLIVVVMWSSIYGNGTTIIKGFTLEEMITYLLFGSIIDVTVRNFVAERVATEIKDGQLSIFLVQPVRYFLYAFARAVGTNMYIILMSLSSQLIVVALFFDKFIVNTSAPHIAVIAAMVALAFLTEFFIGYLIGMIAFWTDEIDGLYSSIGRFKKFFAGGYFPLILLPSALFRFSLFLPFAYSFFVPTQLYLKKINLSAGIKGLLVQAVWIALLYGIIQMVWKRGLQRYEGVGI